MKRTFIFSLILFLLFTLNQISRASHIVGGDISYECLGPSPTTGIMQYRITMHVYRDRINGRAPFDNPAYVGIYAGLNTSSVDTVLALGNPDTTDIPIVFSNPCLIVPPNVGVVEAVYQGIVELPFNPDGYTISYQRCCRNYTVSNLASPRSTGATYTISLSAEAQQQCNSSPTFNEFPPIVICANRDLEFDHSATDVDGNTLVYELCSPYSGGGSSSSGGNGFNSAAPNPPAPPPYNPVVFHSGYSATNPMNANPTLQIDPNTGLLTGFPTSIGQYVVGVCVKEYDAQGNLLSQTLRDFQFNVTICDDQVDAKVRADSVNFATDQYYVNFCGDSIITFDNTSTIQSFINSYEWRIDLGNGTFFIDSIFEPTVTFPGNGTYQGWLIANPGSVGCTDTALLTITISLDVLANFSVTYDSCEIGLSYFTNKTVFNPNTPIQSYVWNFGDGNTSFNKDPNHQYVYPDTGVHNVTLTATDIAGCVSKKTRPFDWTPKPIFPFELPNDTACINFLAGNIPSIYYPISDYTFRWNFGDGTTSDEFTTQHNYTQSGIYSRSLIITSPKGCTEQFNSTVVALDTPRANFSYLPTQPTSLHPIVEFKDESELANLWEWHFGNGVSKVSSFESDITYHYPDTGKHLVSLIVTHVNGCTDTAKKEIDIIPEVTYFLPNALTPNDDGKNDVYKGKGYTQYIKNFEMGIYNRWGERIFATQDPTEAWNGRKNNIGSKCQAGVYVVIVRIVGPRGQPQEIKGYATIVY
ncbi:PKD domain-containing protein [Aureispira sp. CCB-E]|uniref:PKD domain-containing protein n=1 Tax=Aureispira sp. CCB-E TaxID=3051121 RepID=UPI0028692661|nr:PKD domain-containing protein [Aureispira sp. CCB-E]WMX13750.1 PKD domain-containing protein [Aureispira sp. CCB-E]